MVVFVVVRGKYMAVFVVVREMCMAPNGCVCGCERDVYGA